MYTGSLVVSSACNSFLLNFAQYNELFQMLLSFSDYVSKVFEDLNFYFIDHWLSVPSKVPEAISSSITSQMHVCVFAPAT